MLMLATLRRSGGIEAIARQLQIATPQADEAVNFLLPYVLGAFRRMCEDAEGKLDRQALLALLDEIGGGNLAVAVMAAEPVISDCSMAVASRVFGSEASVTLVAQGVERDAGSDGGQQHISNVAATLPLLTLPLLTMLVGGYLAARSTAAAWAAETASSDFADLLEFDRQPNPLDALIPRC